MTDDTALVHERVRAEHADLLRTVADYAAAVAAGWDGDATSDRDAVVPPMRAALERSGALGRLPSLLFTAAAALGTTLPAQPVAAPPYVVVTATGPVVRATLPDRGRVVLELGVFEVVRGAGGARYRLADPLNHGSDTAAASDDPVDPADLLAVSLR